MFSRNLGDSVETAATVRSSLRGNSFCEYLKKSTDKVTSLII